MDLPVQALAGGTPIVFHYQDSPLTVVDNGHTIEVEYAAGSAIEIDGERYELRQFHFHLPSEHTVAGKHLDMSLHLVHANQAGEFAVVGVLLQAGEPGNPAIDLIWQHLPRPGGRAGRTAVYWFSENATRCLTV